MIDWCLEENGWRRIRVRRREVERQLESKAGIGGFVRAGDGSGPAEEVLGVIWKGGDAGGRGHHELHELCL